VHAPAGVVTHPDDAELAFRVDRVVATGARATRTVVPLQSAMGNRLPNVKCPSPSARAQRYTRYIAIEAEIANA
jgi:hypothetical protein